MPQPAIYEPTLLHPEQIVAKKPWERQEGESAKWFFRFRNYLALGSNRSVNAVFDAENKKGQAKARQDRRTLKYRVDLIKKLQEEYYAHLAANK